MSDEETKICPDCAAQGCDACNWMGFADITSADSTRAMIWWKSLTRPQELAERTLSPTIAMAWVKHKKAKAGAPDSNPPPAAS